MGVGLNHERRDLLKPTLMLGGAAASIPVWESRNALGAPGAMPLPQAHGIAEAPRRHISRISANTIPAEIIPAEIKDATVDGDKAYSPVSIHFGRMLSNWDAPAKQFPFPCDDATFAPLRTFANTGGTTSRMLPYFPFKAVNGKLVVADRFSW